MIFWVLGGSKLDWNYGLGIVASGTYVDAIYRSLCEYCIFEGRNGFFDFISKNGVPLPLLLKFIKIQLILSNSRDAFLASYYFLNVIFVWFFCFCSEIYSPRCVFWFIAIRMNDGVLTYSGKFFSFFLQFDDEWLFMLIFDYQRLWRYFAIVIKLYCVAAAQYPLRMVYFVNLSNLHQ